MARGRRNSIPPKSAEDESAIYVFIAYDRKSPHLPLAVADTKSELARLCGITLSAVDYYLKNENSEVIRRVRVDNVVS